MGDPVSLKALQFKTVSDPVSLALQGLAVQDGI